MFLAASRSDLGESILITTLLGIPLGEPDGQTPTAGAHHGASATINEEFDGTIHLRRHRKPESSALASCSDINNIADSLGEIGFSDLIRNNESNLDPTRLLTVFG